MVTNVTVNSGTGRGKPSSVTQRGRTEPFELQISRQDIAYHNQFELCGYSANIGTTAGPAWEGNTGTSGAYAYPGSAVVMTLVSTTTDTQILMICGLDANFNTQTEIVTLNGVTNVNTVGAYLRVNALYILNGSNVGTITCKNGGTTYAQINPGIGQSQMSVYTVPNGYTLHLYSVQAETNIHYTSTIDYVLSEYNKQNIPALINLNGVQVQFQAGQVSNTGQAPTNALFSAIYQIPSVRPQGTDIQWSLLASTGTTNPGSIIVSGYLIANAVA